MTRQNLKIFIVFLFVVSTRVHYGQQAAFLSPVPRSEFSNITKNLDHGLLPNGADKQLDPLSSGQVFSLNVPNEPTLTVVPISFVVREKQSIQEPTFQCGVYFIQRGGKSRYISTVGLNYAEGAEECDDIKAMGTMPDRGPHPRLIALFGVESPHGDHYTATFILSWNAASSAYKVDQSASDQVDGHLRGAVTIANVRRFFAQHPSKP